MDTERLDWMIAHEARVIKEGYSFETYKVEVKGDTFFPGMPFDGNPRTAIDAAMSFYNNPVNAG